MNTLPLNVHVNDNSIATTPSFKNANKILTVRVTMEKYIERDVNVILKYGTVFKFNQCVLGLYYYDMVSTDEHNSAKTNATITPYSLLSILTENK